MLSICSSTSFIDILPRNTAATVRYLPCRGETGYEEVQSRERDHVDSELSQIGIKLAGESQASSDAAQGRADQMIEIAVGRRGQLESPEADIVERLVVYAIRLIRVLHQLMHRERAIVGLNHGVRHLRKEARVDADAENTRHLSRIAYRASSVCIVQWQYARAVLSY
ncbi:hypothetical protein X777_09317 [Ooceraea biroi]|uniref:Uncharacterized protein n=1 Tax=Ooceraea biroi TaxID=2015173 RepID=A0A026X127_OOCBI|nr:hypothetical protein X777_09317 [Ooceraea biroi]